MNNTHTSETRRLQRSFERWELQHLRDVAARQARRIERLQLVNRLRCERMVALQHQAWDAEGRADMFMDFNRELADQLDGQTQPGLTMEGRLVLVQQTAH